MQVSFTDEFSTEDSVTNRHQAKKNYACFFLLLKFAIKIYNITLYEDRINIQIIF